MTAIIAYGTVVRSPSPIRPPLPDEEPSIAFSVIVEEDFRDESGGDQRRGLYRVVLVGDSARFALSNLRVGSPVFIRGELFQHYSPSGDPAWNYRLVLGEEAILLAGELPGGRAYALVSEPEHPPTHLTA
jgi:single-stranded DNA-binding protein